MAGLNETPQGNRIHIAFFGLRNAGKSTLVNAFTGQQIAIVSDVPGTTTDPVSKAMEILPLGPCLVTDTAGLDDDAGELGALRVEKTLKVLETTDIAVWVWGDGSATREARGANGATGPSPDPGPSSLALRTGFLDACKKRNVVVLEYRRGDSVGELKKRIAAIRLEEKMPGLLDGLVSPGDRVVCVVPIDESAPKGRLILPQQQVIRECLDRHLTCSVCQTGELFECLHSVALESGGLVVTDSQAFEDVSRIVGQFRQAHLKDSSSRRLRLTSFSILFARQKGDVAEYVKGLRSLKSLRDGDTVLIAEGCTHHRQCNDIGSVKIPKALARLTGRQLNFVFSSGTSFLDSGVQTRGLSGISLVVHCGGCMLTRREVLRRIALAKADGIPIVNYGMVLGLGALDGLEGLAGLEGVGR